MSFMDSFLTLKSIMFSDTQIAQSKSQMRQIGPLTKV